MGNLYSSDGISSRFPVSSEGESDYLNFGTDSRVTCSIIRSVKTLVLVRYVGLFLE